MFWIAVGLVQYWTSPFRVTGTQCRPPLPQSDTHAQEQEHYNARQLQTGAGVGVGRLKGLEREGRAQVPGSRSLEVFLNAPFSNVLPYNPC